MHFFLLRYIFIGLKRFVVKILINKSFLYKRNLHYTINGDNCLKVNRFPWNFYIQKYLIQNIVLIMM